MHMAPAIAWVLGVLITAAHFANGHPTRTKRQIANSTSPSAMPSSIVVVTGAAEGGIQPRLEIHDLFQDPELWNVYLLALQSFQATDTSDPLSWYQIGGIHGQPFVPYNAVQQCQGCVSKGYCTHSSTLFPTWHRGYMALFEQSLQANAIAVASRFSGNDRQRYLDAAARLRAPYWDWALPPFQGEAPFPSFFTNGTVIVNTPSGQQTIANPLLSYSFPNDAHPAGRGATTVRSPRITTQTRQQSRYDLWALLTSQSNYNEFSTRALPTQHKNSNSLEAIHDSIHVDIGGDMGDADTAGFDPVFWLHHAMVDRILTLYQAAWPETWIESVSEVGESFTTIRGEVQNSTSVLEPFKVDSNAVRDTSYYNYHYADLASGKSAADIINDLYGSQAPPASPAPAASAPSATASFLAKRSDEAEDSETARHEYVARVEVDLPGSEGSFDIFVFDGEPDTTAPETWYEDADFLGQHGFFTSSQVKGNHEEISTASVSLTASLQRRVESGELKDLQPKTVARYSRDKMQWRIVNQFGKEVHSSKIPMLQVNVLTAKVAMPARRGAMPKWGRFELLVGCDGDVGAWINGWCSNV